MATDSRVRNRRGQGRPGYCKICDSVYADPINNLLNEKKNAAEIARALSPFGFKFDRATLKKHADHSEDPVTTFVKMAKREGAVREVTSNEEFLSLIRNAAARNAELAPEMVTVDQGIKAANTLMADRNQRDSLKLVLMKVMTGRSSQVIEGEWTEEEKALELETDDDELGS